MILDKSLEFDPAGTAITTDQASTNIINLVNARDMGIGDAPSLKVLCSVTTSFNTTDAATLRVEFQGSTDSTTWTTYAQSAALASATLTAGRQVFPIDVPRPPPGAALPQYLRLYYNEETGTFTAGALGAWLVIGRDDVVAYPKNYTAP